MMNIHWPVIGVCVYRKEGKGLGRFVCTCVSVIPSYEILTAHPVGLYKIRHSLQTCLHGTEVSRLHISVP